MIANLITSKYLIILPYLNRADGWEGRIVVDSLSPFFSLYSFFIFLLFLVFNPLFLCIY